MAERPTDPPVPPASATQATRADSPTIAFGADGGVPGGATRADSPTIAFAEAGLSSPAPTPGGGAPAPLPTSIAGYRLGRQLGVGGMGMVYEAQHPRLKRSVALKLLKPEIANVGEFKQRFLREAQAMSAVSHPHVIAIHDAGEADGYLYMALELVQGGDLARLLRRRGTLEPADALAMVADCARGLQAIHLAGLVHRDIKPQNIFLDRDGRPKIGDLGLARSTDGEDRMTMTGTSYGTPSYMSPEQIRGIADIDIRSDIYALGATLFTLVCGLEPYTGATSFVVTHKVLSEPTPDPRQTNQLVPPAVAAITRKAMAKEREARYATPEELLQDLERARAGQTLIHTPSVAAPTTEVVRGVPAGARRAERPVNARIAGGPVALPTINPQIATLIAASVVVAVLVAVWWSMSGSDLGAPATPVADGDRPAWASAGGTDAIGRWADIEVAGARARLRAIPAGEFWMGSPEGEPDRRPDELRHQVTLTRDFWMLDGECSQALWRAVMGEEPSAFPGAGRPVERVSWEDCQEFCAALGRRLTGVEVRLPSEAEWEYACRAGSPHPWSNGTTLGNQGWAASGPLLAAWRDDGTASDETREAAARAVIDAGLDPEQRPRAIATRPANAWGLHDLHGNLLEWCDDAWDRRSPHPAEAASDPRATVGDYSVCRGGSWFLPPERSRSAARHALLPGTRADHVGFRVVVLER